MRAAVPLHVVLLTARLRAEAGGAWPAFVAVMLDGTLNRFITFHFSFVAAMLVSWRFEGPGRFATIIFLFAVGVETPPARTADTTLYLP